MPVDYRWALSPYSGAYIDVLQVPALWFLQTLSAPSATSESANHAKGRTGKPTPLYQKSLKHPPSVFPKYPDLKKTSTYLEEKAITVDLSSHGLCFSCDRLLQPDTMIYYAVEGENKRDLAHGLGRVIWSKQVENQPLFHIGVDFSSHSPQLEHH